MNDIKFLIIGNGYIGNYLNNKLDNSVLTKLHIEEQQDVRYLIREYPYHVIINAAGATGRPNIDWCETHKAKTIHSNVYLPIQIAEICAIEKQYWINIGSGCIYNGYDKEWTEDDIPNFDESFYSYTKSISQKIVNTMPYSCTLRIRMPIDSDFGDRCLISKLLSYAKQGNPVMSDNTNSMTYLDDLIEIIKFVSINELTGTYNAVNRGSLSAIQVLELYKKYIDPNLTWKSKTYNELVNDGYIKSARSNCILSGKKLENEGFLIPKIEDRLIKMLRG